MHRHRHWKVLLAASLVGVAGAAVARLPDLKPGLWETVEKDLKTGKSQTISACYTKEYLDMERKVTDDMAKNPDRPCKSLSHSAGDATEVIECTMNGATWRTTNQGTISAERIHSVSHTQLVKGERLGLPPDSETDMRYKGACPAGMEGGDTIMPDGKKMNMMKFWQQK